MINLDSILKSRDIILPTKVHLVKAMVFPVSCVDVRVGVALNPGMCLGESQGTEA